MTALFKKSSSTRDVSASKPRAKKVDSQTAQAETPVSVAVPATEDSSVITGNVLNVKFPWITEKISRISKDGQYAFVVADECNKAEAKKLIEKIYHVHVTAVNVINIVGKRSHRGARVGGREGFKKVIVTLKKGETIDVVPH